jgi:P63C domain
MRTKDSTPSATLPKATHGSPDSPLRIGQIEIPCYVLNNGTRVITQRGMTNALHMKNQQGKEGLYRLRAFANGKRLNPFISKDLLNATQHPMLFTGTPGGIAYGYEATVLVDLVCAIVDASDAQALTRKQHHIAAQCRILIKAFAKVGIIALVDEATGYQADRDQRELHKILAAYLSPELMPWTKRFPEAFYEQMFRLQGWTLAPGSTKRPLKAGELTAQIVYQKMPHGVLEELRRQNPVRRQQKWWSRQYKHHQFLTDSIGHSHLQNHLVLCTGLMLAADSWEQFLRMLHRAVPSPEPLPFETATETLPAQDA